MSHYIVLLRKNYHDREACPAAGQGKIFVFFVPFVVQFWLRQKPRYVRIKPKAFSYDASGY